MKFCLVGLFLVFQSFFVFASPLQSNQIIIQDVDILTWPANLTATQVLDIYIEIMSSDSEAKSILDKTNLKLKTHNINHIREIFKYCDGQPPSQYATAFFSQNVKIIETRISIPGIPESPWSASAQTVQEEAFSFKVIKTPFIEFLAVSDRPEICIHRGKELLSAYDSVVHEMTHFLLKDPFLYNQEIVSSKPFPDFIQMTVVETGGELDAFKIGSSAAIRMLKRYNIKGYSSESYQFFDSDGVLIAEEGLKNYLIKTYTNYYKNTNTLSELRKSKLSVVGTKVNILKGTVVPIVHSLSRSDLYEDLSSEIITLEELKSQL